jgi:hypothetical protein
MVGQSIHGDRQHSTADRHDVVVPDTAAELTSAWSPEHTCYLMPFDIPLWDGTVITCPSCGAERDWLLLRNGPQISVRCRCTHQWVEPRLPVEWYVEQHGPLEEVHPTEGDVHRDFGFDGTLAGTYWD